MTKIFSKISKKNATDLRKELIRAHIIIALLSISVIGLISLNSIQYITLDPLLSAICVILLSIVTFTSLCTAFALSKVKK